MRAPASDDGRDRGRVTTASFQADARSGNLALKLVDEAENRSGFSDEGRTNRRMKKRGCITTRSSIMIQPGCELLHKGSNICLVCKGLVPAVLF